MPETEGTPYDIPIPLRDNGMPIGLRASETPLPSPYTRLEAVRLVTGRLRDLTTVLNSRPEAPNVPALGAVIRTLSENLDVALTGDLEAVRDLVEGHVPLGFWYDAVVEMLWPSVG